MTISKWIRWRVVASVAFGLCVGLSGGGCSSDEQVTDPNATKVLNARIKRNADGDDGPVTRKGKGKAAPAKTGDQ